MKNKKCLCCGTITTNPKFCSRSCSTKIANKVPKRKLSKKCTKCDNIARNYRSTLCENHFQDNLKNKKDYIKSLTLSDYTERECIKKLHKSSKFAHIRVLCRSWNKNKTMLPCFNCGYSKHVELAHIIPISSFPSTATIEEVNSPNNVIQLCPNCHWEFDNNLLSLVFPEQSESQ